jgi:uncharacterized glyoxalase superfamily protein PhnB
MTTSITIKQLTPILIVDQIEPCLAFWVDRLGFAGTIEIPDEDGRLVFAAVQKDGIEIMYQRRDNVLAEDPDAATELVGHSSVLYLTVENLDAIALAVAGAPLVKPRHKTFYGSMEIYVREPGGNRVGFAQPG